MFYLTYFLYNFNRGDHNYKKIVNIILNIKFKYLKCTRFSIHIQLSLGSLRTFDVTHSRLVTHFRILKKSKKKFTFLILHKLNLLYIIYFFL